MLHHLPGKRRYCHTMDDAGRLLTCAEVAELFRVGPKTVTRWVQTGRLSTVRTPGGHHRFREAEVLALLSPAGSVPVP